MLVMKKSLSHTMPSVKLRFSDLRVVWAKSEFSTQRSNNCTPTLTAVTSASACHGRFGVGSAIVESANTIFDRLSSHARFHESWLLRGWR